ncbi:MAG: hypothetical protein Q9225_001681 [Loekoesia sp. 1 TL-2023]
MADKPSVESKDTFKDALPASRPKPAGNPLFRMMGLPNFRLKLPSRNWLIFLSITGSFTAAIFYDRYHKKKAQQRWCNLVSHIAQEPMSSTQLPRRITIFLSAPPGDSLRAAREHFHEYAKPVLVAGALDWDVVEGRREGDVRAGLAEKIRKRRRKTGEKPMKTVEGGGSTEEEDLVKQLRDTAGIREWDGVQGDLILGRHTWKEYIRGLHEGWLGPLEPPLDPLQEPASATANTFVSTERSATDPASPISNPSLTPETSAPISDQEKSEVEPLKPEGESQNPENKKEKEKPKQPTQEAPYISPSAYPTAPLAPSVPESLPPSTVLPFPHLLGFLGTPIRIYRFLNRRYLADDTGRQVAALVLASRPQNWNAEAEFVSSADPDASPSRFSADQSSTDVVDLVPTQRRWELEGILEDEERDWHKSARQSHKDDGERVWKERIVVDSRIGERMRRFQLREDEEEKARKDDGVDPAAKGLSYSIKQMVGWEEDTSVKGWEHGLVGEVSE